MPEKVLAMFVGSAGRVVYFDGTRHELPFQHALFEGSQPIWIPGDTAHPMPYLGVVPLSSDSSVFDINTLLNAAIPVRLVAKNGPYAVWFHGMKVGTLPLKAHIAPGVVEVELRDDQGGSSVHALYTVSPPKPPATATTVTLNSP